jgi:HKD family nuclease
MNIQLLGQGYESESKNSVGYQLIKFFNDKKFHTFTGISAFASQSGVNGFAKNISAAKKHLKSITIITGIDQKGTSKEALEALLKLKIATYIFYQPSITIFHPKIYLFEGKEKSELILGSSNLTSQGLFTNIEASLLVSIDNSINTDRKIVGQLKDYFTGIFDHSDPNLKRITKGLISDLVKAKVVPTEAERKLTQDKTEQAEKKETQNIISKIFPKRTIAKIPIQFRGTSKPKEKLENTTISQKPTIHSSASELLWQSGPLTERDLNIPKGSNTNPTGSMLFKKGETLDIDQRHYFRDTVFSSLNWTPDTSPEKLHLERATALFKIIVDGTDCGNFQLTLTHNTKTDTRSYEQKNSMTSISWGTAKDVIAKEELIGKSLNLYRNDGEKNEFTIVIE